MVNSDTANGPVGSNHAAAASTVTKRSTASERTLIPGARIEQEAYELAMTNSA
jgi:hypothetical protein